MQVGRTCLTPEECHCGVLNQLFIYCGQPKGPAERGHIGEQDFIYFQLSCLHKSSCTPPVVIWVSSHSCFCGFQPWWQFYWLSLSWPKSNPIEAIGVHKTVNTLDGRCLATITHRTLSITITISGNHCELLQLFVIPSPSTSGIGSCLLRLYNPHIEWLPPFLAETPLCNFHCLHSAATPAKVSSTLLLNLLTCPLCHQCTIT